MSILKTVASAGLFSSILKKLYSGKELFDEIEIFGLKFKNKVGLAAGFDKNASWLKELSMLGFGHIEIGTVTPLPQGGNDKPRLFRLPKDKALINRMGFNNAGVNAVAEKLKTFREKNKTEIIIGGNIGKNKVTPNEDAWKDYEKCFNALHPYVDYFVVNVSSPNTPGLRELQERDALEKILGNLITLNNSIPQSRPILLKIAPDLSLSQVDEVTELALAISLNGLVVSNTTIKRDGLTTSKKAVEIIGAGGLSGKPLFKDSTELVRHIHQLSGGKLPIIASGGIFAGDDAEEKIKSGASLVQVWTGFVYEGPGIAKRITKYLKR